MSQVDTGDGLAVEREFDPLTYLRIARRRYLLFFVTALVVFGGVYWVAIRLPPVYQATATILVQSQQIPTSLAQSTVTAGADERIQIIQQRLMTRDNLLAIARKYNLYSDQPGRSPSDIVDLTRQATAIQQIDVGNRASPDTNAIGFTVSFRSDDPSAAASVANELVTSILQQNVQSRTAQAQSTSNFFDQQISQLQQDLTAKEAQIADFKNKNGDSLPETFSSRQALLAQLQGQSADLRSRIATLQSQRQLLVGQDSAPLSGGTAGGSSVDAQLAQLRLQLVQLKALYSDTHPQVRAIQAQIDALDKASKAATADAANNTSASAGAASSAGSAASSATSPAPNTGPNALRIADIDNQLTALSTQLADVDQRASALDASLQKTPNVEVALDVLMRDYQSLRPQYTTTQAKAAEATTGQQLEQGQQAERFEVLEQATVPANPIAPDRQRIILAGGFGAAVAGIAMVAIAEFLTKSIRTAADLESQLHIRPIVSIPYIATAGERRRKRWRRIAVPLIAMLLLVFGLGAVQIYYLPLDLVAQKIVARLKF